MTRKLRIGIAEDDDNHRLLLLRALERLGHEVVGSAANGATLAEICRAENPDLVITDISMPGKDGLDAAAEIYKFAPVPIIVVTSHYDSEVIQRAQREHILSYLVKPINEANLAPAIALALHRFEEFQTLKKENASLAQALEDRKVIEKAKGLLMKEAQLDEAAAFRRLQKLARDQRMKLADAAKMVVSAAALLKPE